MGDTKQKGMSAEQNNTPQHEQTTAEHNELKREFMKKFGVYAAGAPLGLYAAMRPGKTLAASDGGP